MKVTAGCCDSDFTKKLRENIFVWLDTFWRNFTVPDNLKAIAKIDLTEEFQIILI